MPGQERSSVTVITMLQTITRTVVNLPSSRRMSSLSTTVTGDAKGIVCTATWNFNPATVFHRLPHQPDVLIAICFLYLRDVEVGRWISNADLADDSLKALRCFDAQRVSSLPNARVRTAISSALRFKTTATPLTDSDL